MHTQARKTALGGMLAALAVVLMTMGGMIPVATYVVPMICMLILKLQVVKVFACCFYT